MTVTCHQRLKKDAKLNIGFSNINATASFRTEEYGQIYYHNILFHFDQNDYCYICIQ